jgi:hypothetical protein
VLFSAAYSSVSELHRLWNLDSLQLISSAYAVEEARRNLGDNQQRDRLAVLTAGMRILEDVRQDVKLPDDVALPAKDVPILLAAIAGQASHLLTGDLKHFGTLMGRTIMGVLIQRPADYLRSRTGS